MSCVRSSRSDRSQPPPQSLWRDGDFRRLWAGQTASQFGEQSAQTVLPLVAVLTLGAGAEQLGALRAVEQAPILLCSLLVGAWVDRRRTRSVMVPADLGRAVALALVPVAGLLGVLGMPVLFSVALVVGLLSVFFGVACQASLVRLVPRDRLVRGTVALEGSRSAAQLGGPALGGGLVSLLSAPVAVLAAALCFALSSLSVQRIRRAETVPPAAAGEVRTGRQIREGLRFVAADPVLRTVAVCSAAFQFSFAALMTVYLLFLPRALHLSGAQVGLVFAAMGPGALAGSVLAAWLPGRLGYGLVLVASAALGDGLALWLPALHGSAAVTVPLLMAGNLVFGACGQLVDVTVTAVRQAVTPVRIQGRVVATLNFVGLGPTPLGSLLGGWLAGQWGLRTALLVAAAGQLLSPLIMSLSPLGRLGRSLPSPGQDG
ncbi:MULTISPECIES: MFS transporter [Streptacidiphilus]|uniref:MFS transporter n=1 Tax=Streptacidiphilus cavernicola TaxID=3342716 RepID=A0ABV6UIV6_9ACTN|nr:MFS transporter [Streptacidiphilus jeojiense]